MSGKAPKSPKPGKLLLEEINQLDAVKCDICDGYIIDATSLSECLHTFCRSCIVKHIWRGSLACPTCDEEIHKTRPLLNLRHDPVKQELIYRLVPGLQEREMTRRKTYLEEHKDDFHGALVGRMHYEHCNLIPLPKTMSFRLQSIFGFGITLSEKSKWREVIGEYKESYLRLRVSATFGILQQFIRSKSGDTLSKEAFIMLIFRDLVLDPEDTLAKIQEYDPDPNGQITINFGIYVDKSEPEVKPKPKPFAIASPKRKPIAISVASPKPFTISEPVSKKPKLIDDAVVINMNTTIEEKKIAVVVTPRQTKPARRKNRPPTKIPMNHYHEPALDILGDIMSKGLSVPSNSIKTSSKAKPVANIPNRPNGTKPSSSVSNYKTYVTTSGCYRPIQPAHKVPQKVHHNFPTRFDLGGMDGHAAASLAQQLDQSRHQDRVAPIKLVMSPQSSKANDTSERRCSYVIVSPSDSNEGREVLATSSMATASVTSATSSRPFSSPVARQSNNNTRNILSDLLSKPVTVSTQQQTRPKNPQPQQRHQISNEMRAKPNRRKQQLMKPTHITQSYEDEPPRMRMKEPGNDTSNHNHQHQHQYHQHQHHHTQQQQQQQHQQQMQNNINKTKRPEVCHMNVSFNEAKSRKPPVAVPMANVIRSAVPCSTHQQDGILNMNMPISMAINNFNNNATSYVKQSASSTHGSHQQQQQNADESRRNQNLRNNTDAEAHRIALESARKVMKDSTINTSASTAVRPPPPKKQRQRVILPKPSKLYAVPLSAISRPQIAIRQQQHQQQQPQKKFPPPPRPQKEDFSKTLQAQMALHAASLAKIASNQIYTTNNKTSSASASLVGRNNTCLISRNDFLRTSSNATSSSMSTSGLSTEPRHSLGRVRSSSTYKDQAQPSTSRRLSSGSSGSSMVNMGTTSNGRTFEYRVSSSPSSSCTSGGKHNLPVGSLNNYTMSKSLQQQRTSFPLKRPHHQHHANSSGFVPIATFQEKQKQQQKPVAPVASSTLSDILQRQQQGCSTSSGLNFSPAVIQKGSQRADSASSSRSIKPPFPLGGTTWRLSDRGLVPGAYFTVGDQKNLSPSNRLTSSSSSSPHSCNKDVNAPRTSSSSSTVISQAHDPELPLDFSKKGNIEAASKPVTKDWYGRGNVR